MPQPIYIRRTAVSAKIEATEGVDAGPTLVANAMLVSDVSISPLEQETADRGLYRPYFGNDEKISVAEWSKVDFSVEFAGAGAAGTAPKYGPLLRACGFAQTVTAGTNVAYAPVSDAFESVTINVNVGGVLHKLRSARGSVALSLDARKKPTFRFTFTGLFSPVVDEVQATPDFGGYVKPLAVNKANTPTFTLFSQAVALEALTLDIKNEVSYRNLVGTESVRIGDRKPDGSISFEATKVADKDWWATIRAGASGPLHLVHGVTAGNIMEVDAPRVQINSPKYGDSSGIQMMQGNLVLAPGAAGNDELVITVR